MGGLIEGLADGGWVEFDRGVTGHGGVICRGWDCVDIPKENYTENKVAL